MGFDPSTDYPLGTRRPDLVTTAAGTPLEELTLAGLRDGRVDPSELRATRATLRRQSAIARSAGRQALADNLARAAELASVPDGVVLEVYTALRPHRSTGAELDAWADRLESEFGASLTATFVRDARKTYAERGLLAVENERAGTPAV
jgi:propanediol dehydratase small subunit